jgi:copper chaperone CopZ
VRAGISKVSTVKDIRLQLKPPQARLNYDSEKVSLQDFVAAIRAAGRPFDAKVLLQQAPKASDKVLNAVDKALESVPGVKNTGWPDEKGLREITLDLSKKTTLADLLRAGKSVGVKFSLPK